VISSPHVCTMYYYVNYIWSSLFPLQLHEPDPVLRAQDQLSFEGFARYLMDAANSAIARLKGSLDADEEV